MPFRWQDMVNLLLGLWTFVSAAFLWHAMVDPVLWHSMAGALPPEGVGSASMWSLAVVGLVVTFVALFAALAFKPWLEWLNMMLGLWLLVSPWVFDFHASEALRWNAILTGSAIAALAAWSLTAERAKSMK